MSCGNGIDIIEIERIKLAIDKNQAFLKKVFTEKEITYIGNDKSKYQRAAGIFCAKEAISKALGTGIRFKLLDIEIGHDSMGKPIVRLYDKAKIIMSENGMSEILISISHCKLYAVANAIIL